MKKIFCFLFLSLVLCISFPSQLAFAENVQSTDTVPSRNYTVVIDAGHGGSDPGSIGYKTKVHEADINLKMTYMLKSKLEGAGINVVLTRTGDNSLIPGSGRKWKREDMEARKEIIKNM